MADRRTKIILGLDAGPYIRGLARASTATKAFAKDLDSSDSRMSNLVQTSLALGPALVPIGAAAVPAVAALTAGLGAAAGAAGVAALAFNGVGDGLTALNDYQLEPTAENLEEVRQAFEKLGPAGTNFVMFLDDLEPKLDKLQNTARAGLLPGVEEGITHLIDRAPQVNRIIGEISGALGDLTAEGGKGLASEKFDDFFDYIENEARPILMDMGRTLGNVTEGISNMIVEFDPLSQGFSNGLLDMSRDFAKWTRQLENNEGFQDFVDYVQRVSPKALDTIGAIALALAEIVEAAAPVGEVTLPIIEALAKAIGAIAASDAGPALVTTAAGLAAVSRSFALFNAANGSALVGAFRKSSEAGGKLAKTGDRLTSVFSGRGALAGGIGLVALSLTDLDEKAGLSNTALGAMLGAVAGPWGAAIGGGIGLVKDFADANDDLEHAVDDVDSALRGTDFGAFRSGLRDTRNEIKDARDGLADFGSSDFWLGNPLDALSGSKNSIAEFFTNDIEEAEEKVDRSSEQMLASLRKLRDFTLTPEGGGFENYTMSLKDLEKFASRSQPALRKMGYSLKELKDVKSDEELRRIAAGIRHFTREADSVPGRAADVRKAIKELDNPMVSAADSASELDAALSALMDPDLDAEEAGIAYRTGLMEIRKELAKTNGTLRKFTPAGEANRQMLVDQARALKDLAVAQAKQDGDAKRAFRTLRNGRQDMIDAAEAAGLGRKAAERYIDSLTHIPNVLRTKYETPGAPEAINKAESLDGWVRTIPDKVRIDTDAPGIEPTTNKAEGLSRLINDAIPDKKDINTNAPGAEKVARELGAVDGKIKALDGKNVDVTLTAKAKSIFDQAIDFLTNPFDFAQGGVVDYYANGGLRENHVAQIAPAGANRMWAEPETGGEAYIPLAQSKRPRSRAIADETVSRLGGNVIWNADGNILVNSRIKGDPRRDVKTIDTMFGNFAANLSQELSAKMSKALEQLTLGFHWPLPKKYGYSGSWGSYASGGSHPALDFPAPRGTPIYAVLPGKVMHTTSLGDSYGNYTEVNHGKGLTSLYAHQQRFNTKAGARVMSGQTIGFVNSTGNSTGDHLHLEMQRNGQSYDYTQQLNQGGAFGFPGQYEGSHKGLDRASPSQAQAYAHSIMGRYGWPETQWPYWKDLGYRESGWDWNATNQSSGAYGIPQALPPEKMATAGSDWRTNVGTQIDWMAGYIRERYDGPHGAINWHNAHNWYGDGAVVDLMDTGGILRSGRAAVNLSGQDEAVLNPESTRLLDDLVKALRDVSRKNPGRLQGFGPGSGRRRFRPPDLEQRAEREFNQAQRRLKNAEARLRRYEKAVDRAEERVKDAKGEMAKQEAKNALRNLEERLDASERDKRRAEKNLDRAKADKQTAKRDQKALDKAFGRFDITGDMDKSEVRAEINELLQVVKDTVGKDSGLFKSLERFRDRVKDAADGLDDERKERAKLAESLKSLNQAANQFGSSVAGNFKNDPFTGGLDEFYLQTRADKNDAERFNRLRGRGNRLGLDGPLMKAILASGNVELLAELVRGGRSEIRKAENAYERSRRSANQLGDRAGQTVYGDRIREHTRALRDSDKTIRELKKEIKKLGNDVYSGSYDGNKDAQDGKKKKLQGFRAEARR